MKRPLAVVFVSVLLISALVGMQHVDLAFAQIYGMTVTIKADGSLENATAVPITRNGDVYTLTGDIQGSITVEKSNVTLDGAANTVDHVLLDNVNGVTVSNFVVTNVTAYTAAQSGYGIFLNDTTNSIIENNTVTQKQYGIRSSNNGLGNRIAGNNVTENQYGIHLEGYHYTIIGNNISANGLGIYLHLGFTSTVFGNQIAENGIGIRFFVGYYGYSGEGNIIYSNNFINNSQNVENVPPLFALSPGPVNTWDSGGAGNFWSDYSGTDADGNGVGDSPYAIDDLNQDNFPLMAPLALPELPGKPSVTLLSPANETYAVANVILNFTVNKRVAWMGYSLDGQSNVTVTENLTLTGLSDGTHTLTVYANDTFGDAGASETVTFTVDVPEEPEPSPTTLIVVSVAVIVTAVSFGLVAYFLRPKAKRNET